MAPFRGAPIACRLVVLALLAWVSGLAPFFAQAAHAAADDDTAVAYQDPCGGGCPDDDEGELPCSPVCADCFCGPGTRLLSEPSPAWELVRVLQAIPSAGRLSTTLTPPQDPAPDGLLRPPRA